MRTAKDMSHAPDHAARLNEVVLEAASRMVRISDEQATGSAEPGKWSAKQILGHLVDSAANNHVRFVNAPNKPDMVFGGYDQEEWVRLQAYDESAWLDLVELWKLYNLHIARVMAAIPEAVRLRKVEIHNLDTIAWGTVPRSESTTLDYLMEDYVRHLEHHLGQIWTMTTPEH